MQEHSGKQYTVKHHSGKHHSGKHHSAHNPATFLQSIDQHPIHRTNQPAEGFACLRRRLNLNHYQMKIL